LKINGSTALHLAAANDRLDVVELLVAKGAHIEQWGRYSTVGTPLHVAAINGHYRIVQALAGRFHAVCVSVCVLMSQSPYFLAYSM
jgi:ankyrin repeat protein